MDNTQEKSTDNKVDTEQKGVFLLLNKSLSDYTKLPMFEAIFDKFSRITSNSMRGYIVDIVDTKINSMSCNTLKDVIGKYENVLFCIFKSAELSNLGMIIIQNTLAYSLLEILFGGRKVQVQAPIDERSFTSIELAMVRSIVEILLNDLSVSFEQATKVSFELDRIETNKKFALFTGQNEMASCIEMEVSMEGKSGLLCIVIPNTALDPIKKSLTNNYAVNKTHKDAYWMRHMESEIFQSKTKLAVYIEAKHMLIEDIAKLEVGKTVMLNREEGAHWNIAINGAVIGKVSLGKLSDKVAVVVESEKLEVEHGSL